MAEAQREAGFWVTCAAFGETPCLVDARQSLTYAALLDLAGTWTERARSLLPAGVSRPLVGLEISATADSIAAYLACLRAGWPVILLPPGQVPDPGGGPGQIVATYRPNLLVTSRGEILPADPAPCDMAGDLAVMLSTSGTTGATKLVMLSARNIQSNAAAIVEYLRIDRADAAMCTLALHYSYGLSVLNSYLLAGGRLILTTDSLLEPEFWTLARLAGATSLALVPAQFEMLETLGFTRAHLPGLRYITQAGGRLDARLTGLFSAAARTEGWDFVVMYGQTEASPRIAYVPPADQPQPAGTVGRPIPGGHLWIEDAEGRPIGATGQAGEMIYEGPNVMLGYALARDDLARPDRPALLRTGDIAERLENGMLRIVGRASRFVKLFGLRVGLDEIEAGLRGDGHRALVAGDDRGLVVFLQEPAPDPATAEALRLSLAGKLKLPASVLHVSPLAAVPYLSSGKVDYRTLSETAGALMAARREKAGTDDLGAELGRILRQDPLDTAQSFRELGGDSLAYLEIELLLSWRLGTVPAEWDRRPLSELLARADTPGRADDPAPSLAIGPDLLVRLAAIMGVVLLHATGLPVGGGVYVLTMLAGYSLASFQLVGLTAGRVGQVALSMLLPILLAYYAVILPLAAWFNLDWRWFVLVANLAAAQGESPAPGFLLPYWYVAAYVQIVLGVSLLFLLPPLRRLAGRDPFLFGAGLCVAASLVLLASPAGDLAYGPQIRHPLGTLQLFSLGWCLACASGGRRKAIASGLLLLSYLALWRDADASVAVFMTVMPLVVLWSPRVAVPLRLAQVLLGLGTLTLYIYISHVPALFVARHVLASEWSVFGATLGLSIVLAALMRLVLRRVLAGVSSIIGARPG